MKPSFCAALVLSLTCSHYCLGQAEPIPKEDSTVFTADSLKIKFPHLWERMGKSKDIAVIQDTIRQQKRRVLTPLQRDSIMTARIKKQAGGTAAKAEEINGQIRAEEMYMNEKPNLDIARGKFVINPYMSNYFYWDQIDDPSPKLHPRKKRLALKWQISFQVPIVTAKYSNTGIFAAFTNRGTFDIQSCEDSRPVTHKTFMPEAIGRLDLSQLVNRLEADQIVLQTGVQHESNGGIDDTASLMDSRSIMAKPYLQLCCRFLKTKPDSLGRYLHSEKYKLMVSARGFYPLGGQENPDIAEYIGYLDLNCSYEFAPVLKCLRRELPLGVFMVDAFLSPGGRTDAWNISRGLGFSYTPPMISNKRVYYHHLPKIPLTAYLRYYKGYNEFLYFYNKQTTVLAFGIQTRK